MHLTKHPSDILRGMLTGFLPAPDPRLPLSVLPDVSVYASGSTNKSMGSSRQLSGGLCHY